MRDDRYAVAIVVDIAFAGLSTVAGQMPVWVVDTPFNRHLAEAHWRDNPNQPHTRGVTTFKVDTTDTPDDWCADILSNVDLHHGVYSHKPPYSAVEVFGVPLTDRIRSRFVEFGLTEFEERTNGFRATTA